MKLHSATVIAIILFAIALSRASESEADPYIEVGQLFEGAKASKAGLGFLYNNKWDGSLSYIGEGEDDWGYDTPKVRVISAKRLFHPGWFWNTYFMGIGLAELKSKDKHKLVSTYNFELVAGFKWGDRTRLYLKHFSNLDTDEINTGLNAIVLRIDL